MTQLTLARLLLGTVGLLVFGYGIRAESSATRWAGIVLVALAVAMRFFGRPRLRE
jgi:hypothetical protein